MICKEYMLFRVLFRGGQEAFGEVGGVIKNRGLKYEGRKVDDIFYHDTYHDVDYYYIIRK